MWDVNNVDVEEDIESISDINRSWAVGMIIPTLFSLMFITIAVLSN